MRCRHFYLMEAVIVMLLIIGFVTAASAEKDGEKAGVFSSGIDDRKGMAVTISRGSLWGGQLSEGRD